MLALERWEAGSDWRQDVVVAVAIVAGGHFGGDVGPAQHHGLAVVGVAIMRQPVLVAAAASLVAGGLEIVAVRRGRFHGPNGNPRRPGRFGRPWPESGRGRWRCRFSRCPRWHLPQVAATLAWLMGELRSTLRLMSWTPWQSLQEGATIKPIFSSARPWMLSVYWLATCGYFMRYSAVMPGLLWHLAQVEGRLSLKTGESAFLTGCNVVRAVAIHAGGGGGSPHGLAHAVDAAGVLGGFGGVAGGALRPGAGRWDAPSL